MDARIIQTFVNEIKEGRCALFTGPDLGESAGVFRGLPNSWQLADELAKECGYRGRFLPLPQIADVYLKQKGRDALRLFMVRRLASPEYAPLPIHTIISYIPFPVIVSGGWDTLLEDALKNPLDGVPRHYNIIRTNDDLALVQRDEPLFFQPYGSVSDVNTLRITEREQLDFFYEVQLVINSLRDLIARYSLLFLGYSLSQDTMFFRIYHEIRRLQKDLALPALAVLSYQRDEEEEIWRAKDVEVVVDDPVNVMREIAEAVAREKGEPLRLPDLYRLSRAPLLTQQELDEQAQLLERMMDQIGVSDLVEQTSVPLLSREQLQSIEEMRSAYERLLESTPYTAGSARVWLRQGNLEYARQNYARAEAYYLRALEIEPELAEVYHNLHYVELARRNWKQAFEYYQHAIEVEAKLAIPPDRFQHDIEVESKLKILPDRYQIERVLGSGGLGVVYQALDHGIASREPQLVAVKILQREKSENEAALSVFKREADILLSLEHPNIVHMIDHQQFRGSYFIVMEYLKGQTLQELLAARKQPYSLDEAFELIAQVCEALSYAHSKKIVHRDVKPSNIFVTDGHVHLIDFSLARPITAGEQTLLNAASGTLRYLAPEQARGLPSDERTDIYGAATVFYEMITGVNPAGGTYRTIRERCPGTNAALDIVVEKAREGDPKDRYPTAASFRDDLRRVVCLQLASRNVCRSAHLAQSTRQVFDRSRFYALGLGIFLALGIPWLVPNFLLREVSGYIGAALLIILSLGTIGAIFIENQAVRARSVEISAYGPVLGLVLGLVASLLWLPSFSFNQILPEHRLGYAPVESYIMLTASSLPLSLAVGFASYFVLTFAGRFAERRLKKSYAWGFLLAFALISALLLVLAFLQAGSFGDLSAVPFT